MLSNLRYVRFGLKKFNKSNIAGITSYIRHDEQWIESNEYKKLKSIEKINNYSESEIVCCNKGDKKSYNNTNKIVKREFSSFSCDKKTIESYDKRLIKNLDKKIKKNLILSENTSFIKKNYMVLILKSGNPYTYLLEGTNKKEYFNYDYILYYCGNITFNNKIYIIDSNKKSLIITTNIIYKIIDPVNNFTNLQFTIGNESYYYNNIIICLFESLIKQNICKYSYEELTNFELEQTIKENIINIVNLDKNIKRYGIHVENFNINKVTICTLKEHEHIMIKKRNKATLNMQLRCHI